MKIFEKIKSKGLAAKTAICVLVMQMMTMPVFAASLDVVTGADISNLETLATELFTDIYSSLMTVSNIAGAVVLLIAGFMYFFGSDQKKVDAGKAWAKRVIIALVCINLIGLILGMVTTYTNTSTTTSTTTTP